MDALPEGYATKTCQVTLGEVAELDLEGVLDMLAERAFGSCLLMDIDYEVKAVDERGNLTIAVTGDTSEIEQADESHANDCEGCSHCRFPGIRWPSSPDGYADHSYVDRCDYCERYEGDEEAAKHVAAAFGVRWGYAEREHPENVRWEPASDDALDYTGWSALVDRPERDAYEPEVK